VTTVTHAGVDYASGPDYTAVTFITLPDPAFDDDVVDLVLIDGVWQLPPTSRLSIAGHTSDPLR
jgi:hypothetical protein